MDILKGKIAIVTGANSGIGETTAKLFARLGANVVLTARREDKLQVVENAIVKSGGNALSIAGDVSVEADCKRMVLKTIKAFGKIDILVNNAGIVDKHIPITRLSTQWYDEVIAIDQTSVFYMTREALKYMEPARSGSIINVASIGGIRANSGMAYSAAKAAVIAITKNVAIQFAGKGIRSNAVCPGPTPTALNTPDKIATFDAEFSDICNSHMNLSLPFPSAEDQANAILFFASDKSSSVTGQILTVDGGITL